MVLVGQIMVYRQEVQEELPDGFCQQNIQNQIANAQKKIAGIIF